MAYTDGNNNPRKLFFKSGLQTTLDTLNSVDPGTFYLTEDTNRLYVGGTDGTKRLLNSIVNFIDSVNNLNTIAQGWTSPELKRSHLNDLYYAKNENILAVWTYDGSSYQWTQINPDTDTYVNGLSVQAQSITDGVNVVSTVSRSDSESFANGVSFVAGKRDNKATAQITTDAQGKVVTVTGDAYSIAAAKDGDEAKVTLSSALGQTASDVSIVGGDNITVDVLNNKVQINAEDWKPVSNHSSLGFNKNNNVLSLILRDASDEGVELFLNSANDKFGIYLTGDDPDHPTFVPVGGNLDVYSAGEVDRKFRDLNGLTYRGTVNDPIDSVSTSYVIDNGQLKNNGNNIPVSNGDMFLVATSDGSEFSVPGYAPYLVSGDLLIAQGTEDANGYITGTVIWTVIPSGNDRIIDTTYAFIADRTNHSISLSATKDDERIAAGKLQLVEGQDISISSEVANGNKELTTTVSHATITTVNNPTGNAIELGNGSEVQLVDSIGYNNGHITSITPKKYNLPTYAMDISISANNADGKTGINLINAFSCNDDSTTKTISLSSTSLKIEASNNSADIDIVWGSF